MFGIAIARISDRGTYGLVISACLTLWGAMTMLGGLVQSGFQPRAHARRRRNRRGRQHTGGACLRGAQLRSARAAPLAVITMSIPLASAASLIGGGLLAQALGWRTAFVVMGAISVAFAPLVLVVLGRRQPMPFQPPQDEQRPAKAWDLLTKPSFVAIVAGAACISMAGYSLTAFAPAFLMRARGMSR